jgi:hypothetical protein
VEYVLQIPTFVAGVVVVVVVVVGRRILLEENFLRRSCKL